MGYRKDLENNLYDSNDAAEYNYLYVTKDETINILDEIENRVNEIKDALEPIKGLSEIEEIQNMLDLLSRDLY